MTRLRFGFGALALVACGGPPPPSAINEPAPPLPTPVASSAPRASTSEAPAEPASAAEKSPFHLIAKTEYDLALLPIGDKLFVEGGPIFSLVEGDQVVLDDKYRKGIEGWVGLRQLFGRFPEEAWASIILTNGRIGWGGLRRWKNERWEVAGADLPQGWLYADVSEWTNGSLLALTFMSVAFLPTQTTSKFRTIGKASTAPLPVPTKGNGQPGCATLVRAASFVALKSGEVFSSGVACDTGEAAIEWWPAGQSKGTVERLGLSDATDGTVLIGREKTAVYAFASSYKSTQSVVTRFDGARWEKIENPFKHRVTSATLGPDGSLWVVTMSGWDKTEQGELYRRTPKGEWKLQRMPDGSRAARSIHVSADGTVWLTAGGNLLRSSPPKGAVQQVDWQQQQQFPGTVRIPKLAAEGCQKIFVMMYGITRVTPKDYDFPLTRQAVKGHPELKGTRFVETEENGKRYFGAFVPSLDLGNKLAKLVKDKVKGSIPAVLCHDPKVLRELEVDLTTGEVVKK